jgi:hypothetical protein
MEEPTISSEIRQHALHSLRDFSPSSVDEIEADLHRVEVDPAQIPVPELAYFALVKIVGCEDLGREEKTAWSIPFVFRDVQCELALQKFGLRLYIYEEPNKAEVDERFAEEVISRLSRALRTIEKLVFTPYAEQQIRRGNVTVRNQLNRLRSLYYYFRKAAADSFAGNGRIQSEPSQGVFHLMAEQTEGFFNTVAMVNAYFSMLEHALVLVLPCTDFDPVNESLTDFIGKRWRDKYRRVYRIDTDVTAKKLHDRLHRVSEDYRNTYGHGGFDKKRGALYFHVPDLGVLPAMLSDIRDSPHFEFVPVDVNDFTEICNLFDEVDAWMRSGPTRFGMRWAMNAGLEVAFNASFLAQYRAAMVSEQQFEDFLMLQCQLWERYTNMDW